MPKQKLKPVQKPYKRPEYLLEIYQYMKKYFDENQRHVTNREMVTAGFASSTSVVRYYYDRMSELKMLTHDFDVARGIKLLPLTDADPLIKNLIEKKETEHVSKS